MKEKKKLKYKVNNWNINLGHKIQKRAVEMEWVRLGQTVVRQNRCKKSLRWWWFKARSGN